MRVAKETHKFLIGGVCAESAKKMKFFFSPYLTEEYPNYWSTMPMAVFTFLEHFDFTGKTIHPFCTHEGSGMGSSERDIKRLCPGAKVEKGLAIHGGSVERSRNEIEKWI